MSQILIIRVHDVGPDPPTLAFLKKGKGNPEKSKGPSLRGTLKIPQKREETRTKKARKIGKPKKQGNRKKQGLEGQGGIEALN